MAESRAGSQGRILARLTLWIEALFARGVCCVCLLMGWLGGVAVYGYDLHVSTPPTVDMGEVLLGELNCVSCHQARPRVLARLGQRNEPVLGRDGLKWTASWLREWLEKPHATKPGTGMPDLLHGMEPAARGEAVDTLTHYLISVQSEAEVPAVGADRSRMEQGAALYHGLGCVTCHAPDERPGDMPVDVFDRARAQSVPLGKLAAKYPAAELTQFLLNPVKYRPSGRMPSFNLNEREASALATYLLREQVPGLADPNQPLQTIAGVRWEYFEGSFSGCTDMDRMTAVSTGETVELNLAMATRQSQFGVRYTGVIDVPQEGEYSFWLLSDDGSVLDINGVRLIDNDGDHGEVEKLGTINLKKGPQSFDLRFYQNGGGYAFKISWAGPGIERQPIPSAVLKRYGQPMLPVGFASFAVDPVKAVKGREWFGRLRCAACHKLSDPSGPVIPMTLPAGLGSLKGKSQAGCLADVVPAGAPKYALTAGQRAALRKTVEGADALAQPLSPRDQVSMTMTRLNCYACHDRDGVGGPEASGRSGWLSVMGDADLGEEGRIPPHLTGVGGKLRVEWIEEVLTQGSKVRPYMRTRMPVFGVAHTGALPGQLSAADLAPDALPEPVTTARDAKYGHLLVGRDGLSCVSCHTFGTHGSLGIPGLALDTMQKRLRWDWFRRYLPDPAALRPGTRMPSFWPEGVAVNDEILEGDTDAQIRSIWAWMGEGIRADVPAGMIRGRRELLPDSEPLIYRNFIEGAGPRAIGVGYPERAHLAWDAGQLRLALMWQGAFIDSARHATDRGVGFEPPLGDSVLKFPAGPSVAILADPAAPWPTTADKSLGYRFKGYSLGDDRRPTFYFEVGGSFVTDRYVPNVDGVDVSFTRTIEVRGVAGRVLWLRVATGDVESMEDGTYQVNGRLSVGLTGATGVVVGNELRVPLVLDGGVARVEVQMMW